MSNNRSPHLNTSTPQLFNSSSGTTRNRTRDTRIFSPLLYQLSYGTIFAVKKCQQNIIAAPVYNNYCIIVVTRLVEPPKEVGFLAGIWLFQPRCYHAYNAANLKKHF